MVKEDWRNLDLEDSYHLFLSMGGHESKIYRQVRYGIQTPFDIRDWLDKFGVAIKEKTGKIRVSGKWLDRSDFNTELEQREVMMQRNK